MLGTIFTAVVAYTLKAFVENDEAKKLKNDVLSEYVNWVRPLFIQDDPDMETLLTSETLPAEVKKAAIETNLPKKLAQNPHLEQEFGEWVKKLKAAGESERNVVEESEIDVAGNVHIGQKGQIAGNNPYDRENVVKRSKVKAGKDFRLGDDNDG